MYIITVYTFLHYVLYLKAWIIELNIIYVCDGKNRPDRFSLFIWKIS